MWVLMLPLALNSPSLNYKSIPNKENIVLEYTMNWDSFSENDEGYLKVNILQSKYGDAIQFKKPLLISVKKEDGLYLLEWIEDKDVFGMGETIKEAQEDLLYNIKGILAMRDFDESELSLEAKELLDDLISRIEEVK